MSFKRGGRPRSLTPFWDRVSKSEGCWVWQGPTDRKGYGRASVNGVPDRAHRWAWRLHHGPIPVGQHVLHHCDNPPCVNPAHLFMGTNHDNVRDRESKGRGNHYEGHSNTKLTPAIVREIRCSVGPESDPGIVVQLAQRFGVHKQIIYGVLERKRWRWVPDEVPEEQHASGV